ncbi:MAG: formate/nitrite transporter family protein [Pseudonocardiaceae bacterium]
MSTRAASVDGNEPHFAQPATARLTAAEIYAAAVRIGEDELKRSSTGLALSGLAAGLGMGLTALGSAAILAEVGEGVAHHLLVTLLYPLGFIVVVVGRAQLFTENTLFPVILVLDRRRHLRNTLRLWAVVFISNVVGALLFAVLMIKCGAVSPEIARALSHLGSQTVQGGVSHLFWAGVAGGWIIALMAWLVTASRFTIAQIVLIYLMTFVVGAASLAHCIAGSTEALSAVLAGQVSVGTFAVWLLAATVGNTVGGVIIVSLLNYGQVMGSGRDLQQRERPLADIEADNATGNSAVARIREHRRRYRWRRDNTFR